jgi:UDP-2,3-diacylglucosamine pyrophosphatase LpxH
VLHGETILGLPLGGFSNRYLISVLGFFNPRSTDYICNAFGYFAHWRRFYAGTRRSALWGWLTGSAMVLVRVLGLRRHLAAQAPAHARRLARTAARYGLPVRTLETLDRAKPRPIAYNSFRILREYWLDRVALAFGLTVAAALFVLLGPLSAAPALLAAALVSAALVTAYEKLVATDGVFTVDREIKRYSDQIAKLLGAQVVVMGHTHRPSLERLPGGAAFVNTGTWAPMYTWRSLDQAHPGYRNTLQVLLAPDRIELDLCSADPGPQDRPSSVVLLRQAVAEDPESPSAFIAGG